MNGFYGIQRFETVRKRLQDLRQEILGMGSQSMHGTPTNITEDSRVVRLGSAYAVLPVSDADGALLVFTIELEPIAAFSRLPVGQAT